jgi:lysophospholipid acyltransferase (LPLAT)-like uncharacterized protein
MPSLQKIKTQLITQTAKVFIQLIHKTCRIHPTGTEIIRGLRDSGTPIIYTFWHRQIFFFTYHFQKTGARPLISLSTDGELISQVATSLGMNPVRGSSSRGGTRAFLELTRTLKEHKHDVLITADGPRGPSRQVKIGIVQLAQKTRAVIVPISWYASRVKIFHKTWDKFLMPLPFSHIRVDHGLPITVPSKAGENELEKIKMKLKQAMDKLEADIISTFQEKKAPSSRIQKNKQ